MKHIEKLSGYELRMFLDFINDLNEKCEDHNHLEEIQPYSSLGQRIRELHKEAAKEWEKRNTIPHYTS